MDAANVDLKGFTEEFYYTAVRRPSCSRCSTRSSTWSRRRPAVCFEITTLLIPGRNDSDEELRAQCKWIKRHLGPDVPLHFTAFHPDWKMRDVPATPPATLRRAREIARLAGLRYVYTGNVHDEEGGSTYCPSCEHPVIVRDWYEIRDYRLSESGECGYCGTRLAGRWQKFGKPFGARRIPVRIEARA